MLNYVWMSLIVIGLLVGAGNDINDEVRNRAPPVFKMDGQCKI